MTIEVTDVEVSESYSTQEVHFSGGLRGFPANGGWALFPVSDDADLNALLFRDARSHRRFAIQECGLSFIGTCMRYQTDRQQPSMDVWESGGRDPSNGLRAADSWGAIAYQAELKADHEYALCASSVSACLKVAGLRLRDASNRYHEQLKWALIAKKKIGAWFSNAAILELYADCHSLASELSSTRDHLARAAAIHSGAPTSIDSLARLEAWVSKPSNQAHASQPLVQLLLSASGTKESPGWLRRLGEVRNEMLHRVPMGANKRVSGLTLQEVNTSQGNIKSIRLAEPPSRTPLADQNPDPLVELSELSARLEQLCRAAWKTAKYPALLPHFESRTSKEPKADPP